MVTDVRHIKNYSPREERLSAGLHLLGAVLVFAGAVPLFAVSGKPTIFYAARSFYWVSLLLMFAASSLYHLSTEPAQKQRRRNADHCAIYLLITGTYAPLISTAVPNKSGALIMLFLGILTLAGILGNCFFAGKFRKIEVGIFLVMGWCCLAVWQPLTAAISRQSLTCLIGGGIFYTAGVIPYLLKKEFCHAAWHLLVLLGAACHFAAVLHLL